MLREKTGREKSNKDPKVPRAALDSHGKIQPARGMSFGNPGNADRMIKARKNSHYQIEKKKGEKARGARDERQHGANPDEAQKLHDPVLEFVGVVSDDNLKNKRYDQPQVGQDPYLRIFLDDLLPAVKNRKDHRDGHRGSIVEGMEERSGKEDFFLHGRGTRFYPKEPLDVNLRTKDSNDFMRVAEFAA
jgi:hypothetical protein